VRNRFQSTGTPPVRGHGIHYIRLTGNQPFLHMTDVALELLALADLVLITYLHLRRKRLLRMRILHVLS
jgi:hypothetical protein